MIHIKTFTPAAGGSREWHAIITPSSGYMTFKAQLAEVLAGMDELRSRYPGMQPVMQRWFLSDPANQTPFLPDGGECAMSVVGQSPLDGTQLALWLWLSEGGEMTRLDDNRYRYDHGPWQHIIEGGRNADALTSFEATVKILSDSQAFLEQHGGSLLRNCVRTWFFVHDVDVNYHGVVKGRNMVFEWLGLSPSTRFIASTGIGGNHPRPEVNVQMDSYSLLPVLDGQMRQINDPDYLNPTVEYGVAFERATSIDYGDRRHLFISGTASIDNKGEVVYVGDIRRQTERMLTNIEALLRKGECGFEDVMHLIVYLRDPADHEVVNAIFAERLPTVPRVIVIAPVCRPEWLVETECMAVKSIKTDYPRF